MNRGEEEHFGAKPWMSPLSFEGEEERRQRQKPLETGTTQTEEIPIP